MILEDLLMISVDFLTILMFFDEFYKISAIFITLLGGF